MIYISNNLFLTSGIGSDFTPDNPIIGYQSVLSPSDITADLTSVRPAINAWSPDTSLVWEGESYSGVSATITQHFIIANTTGASVDYIGIARHNFGTNGYEITLQQETSPSVWADISTPRIVANNDAFIEYFDATTAANFRIRIRKTTTSFPAPIIGHVKLGNVLILQRRIYAGHEPAKMGRNVKRASYGSENGQYLGQVVLRSWFQTTINQENNTPAFVRGSIVPFIEHVSSEVSTNDTAVSTFFFSWRPSTYPDDVIYGWTRDNIRPDIQGGGDNGGRVSWSCGVEAIA